MEKVDGPSHIKFLCKYGEDLASTDITVAIMMDLNLTYIYIYGRKGLMHYWTNMSFCGEKIR